MHLPTLSLNHDSVTLSTKTWYNVKRALEYLSDICHWSCEHSSTGYCVYNITDDPAMDCCLICGDPAERK